MRLLPRLSGESQWYRVSQKSLQRISPSTGKEIRLEFSKEVIFQLSPESSIARLSSSSPVLKWMGICKDPERKFGDAP